MLEEVWLLICLNIATSKLQSSLLVDTCAWQGRWASAIQPSFASEIPVWGGMQPFWLLFPTNWLVFLWQQTPLLDDTEMRATV